MIMARSARPADAPLFAWREWEEIARLEDEREMLRTRLERLPRFSHRRVELEARLRAVTARQLQLTNAIRGQA